MPRLGTRRRQAIARPDQRRGARRRKRQWRQRIGAMHAGVPVSDVAHDVVRVGAGPEQFADALTEQRIHVVTGDDATAREQPVSDAALAHESEDLREYRHVRTREHRERHHVDVLLDRGLDDLLGRLVESGVDHLHAAVAERGGHDLGATVVPIKPGLTHQHADLALHDSSNEGPHRARFRVACERGCPGPWPRTSGATLARLRRIGHAPAARYPCRPRSRRRT